MPFYGVRIDEPSAVVRGDEPGFVGRVPARPAQTHRRSAMRSRDSTTRERDVTPKLCASRRNAITDLIVGPPREGRWSGIGTL